MDVKEQLYNSEKSYNTAIKNVKNSRELCERNRKLILDFAQFLVAKRVSKIRIRTVYLPKLKIICKTVSKDLDELEKEDVVKIMNYVETAKNSKGSNRYGKETRNHFVVILKTFYRWLHDLDSNEPAPKVVSWLKKIKVQNTLRKEDLPTEFEINTMINSVKRPMWKALIGVLAETGLRPGELRGTKLNSIHVQAEKIKIYVAGKTEDKLGERFVFVYKSYKLLSDWLNTHPQKNNSDAFLFLGKDGNSPISQHELQRILKKAALDCGIKKKITAYRFRHFSITSKYSSLGDILIKKFAGHSPSSNMISRYAHMSDMDLENMLDEREGVKQKRPNGQNFSCGKCGKPYHFGENFCNNGGCGAVLNIEAAVNYDGQDSQFSQEEMKLLRDFIQLLKRPNVQQFLAKEKRRK